MSEAPRRLLEDPAISDSLKEELRSASEGSDVHYDQEKGLERLRAAIAPIAPSTPGDGGAGAAAAGGAKLAIIGVTAVVVIAGAIGIAKIIEKQPTPAMVSSGAETTPMPPSATPAPSEDDDVPTLSLSALPAESAAPAALHPSASSSATPEQRLREEMAELAEVRSALNTNPARALSLANEGHQKFKGGIFYQEREALAISALNRLGRSGEAKTRAQAFLSAYPKGPYAERIRKETGL